MKLRELVEETEKSMDDERESRAMELIRNSLLRVEEAEKTLEDLRDEHENLLELDLDEIELNDYVY